MTSDPGLSVVNEITVGQILTMVMIVTAVVGTLAAFIKKINPFTKEINNFLEDWRGEEARPGRERRPGVMEQMETLGQIQQKHNQILQELVPNHGSTIKDKVSNINDVVQAHERQLTQLERQTMFLLQQIILGANLEKVDRIETKKEASTFMGLISKEMDNGENHEAES